jgi:6-phosphogluconolactonase
MEKLTRRDFVKTASAVALTVASAPAVAVASRQRVFVASGTPEGILAFDWNPATGELVAAGVAAKMEKLAWLTYSANDEFLYSASELESFNGKPTGEVASFRVANGELHPHSTRNSSGKGTCHVALDHSGKVLVAANYDGGSAASFLIDAGQLSPVVWNEQYMVHGPNTERQQSAHAHFSSFSPDNRFVYINDLGGDFIHIYKLNAATAELTPAGSFIAKPGAGPRTLHFHPNGHTAYCVNELDSTVYVLEWNKADGSLSQQESIDLLPEGYHGPTRACDTVISKDGRHIYFANRDNDFLYAFKADPASGKLTPMGRSSCGGKTPRNFVLDPTERWMLVANQDSNLISVFARNRETGALADQGKSYAAATPMRILFR